MERPNPVLLRIGDWRVDPRSGEISRDGATTRLEARTIRLLLHLAEHAGEVVSIDDLLKNVWAGVIVTSDSVYQAVATLRRVLGDDSKQPVYIETVPRLGYRLVATVNPWTDRPVATIESSETAGNAQTTLAVIDKPTPTPTPTSRPRPRVNFALGAVAIGVLCVALVGALWFYGTPRKGDRSAAAATARVPQRSIAVLPFVDLTEAMDEEPFADGMTEELINRLGRIPDLRVPAPRSSFYFKGKKLPVAVIAESLGVAYVLDGSVRKSGSRLRVAARVVRAGDGYIAWSETYDRSFDDILMVQDDIAGKVTRALLASIQARPGSPQ
jgi:TolB-like protein/DNA-binding winged helix-turn-helix (wHTH) protein